MNRHEPAFPTQMWDEENKEATWLDGGLTKREYFAGLAMQGMVSRGPYLPKEMVEAIKYADALLLELEKK